MLRARLAADLRQLRNTHTLRFIDSDDPLSCGADEIVFTTAEPFGAGLRVEIKRVFPSGESRSSGEFLVAPSPRILLKTSSEYLTRLYSDRSHLFSSAPPGDYIALSRIYLDDDYEQALSDLKSLRDSGNAPVEAYAFEASVARYLFQLTEDSRYLSRARSVLSLAPVSDSNVSAQIELELSVDNIQKARTLLAELDDTYPYLWLYKSKIAEAEGDLDAAIHFVASAETSYFQLEELSRLALLAGEYQSAQLHATRALEMLKSPAVLRRLASTELHLGNLDAAGKIYDELISDSPFDSTDIANSATIRLLRGQYLSAIQAYEYLLEIEPDNTLYTLNLADACYISGDSRAESLFKRFLELSEGQDDELIIAARAQAHAALGNSQKAISLAESLAESASAEALYLASLTYAIIDDESKMLDFAKKSMDHGKGDAWFSLPYFGNITPKILSAYNEGKNDLVVRAKDAYQRGFNDGQALEKSRKNKSRFLVRVVQLIVVMSLVSIVMAQYRNAHKARALNVSLKNRIDDFSYANNRLIMSIGEIDDALKYLQESVVDCRYYLTAGLADYAEKQLELAERAMTRMETILRGKDHP
jgi:Flp pilus assembly protein TadD